MKVKTVLVLVEMDNGHVHQVLASAEQKRVCVELMRSDEGVLRLSEQLEPITLKFANENKKNPAKH